MARNQPKKRGGIGGWIVFAALAWFVWNIFQKTASVDTEPAAPLTSDSGSVTTSDPRYAGSYARSPLIDTWPPLAEGSGSGAQASALANYMVVLDGSGSMAARECSGDVSKLDAAVAALEVFVQSVPDDANLGLAVFDQDGVATRVKLGTGNRDAFVRELRDARANGGTPLRSAITAGYEELVNQATGQLGYGEYHLVVVTDGYPDPASEDPTPIVATLLDQSPVVLHTIGFCIGSDHVLNQPGRVFYVAADSPDQLAAGLSSVLAEAPQFDVADFPQD